MSSIVDVAPEAGEPSSVEEVIANGAKTASSTYSANGILLLRSTAAATNSYPAFE
jgi:hypothetical protein